MIIAVGSTNPVKIEAVRDAISRYPSLSRSEVLNGASPSGVPDQPLRLEDTLQGARNRALHSFDSFHLTHDDLGIGIEGGIGLICGAGYFHLEAAVLYDGEIFYQGISPGIEIPPNVLREIRSGKTLGDAFFSLGLTENPRLGSAEGFIGVLSGMRMDRKQYTIQALMMALATYDHKELYKYQRP